MVLSSNSVLVADGILFFIFSQSFAFSLISRSSNWLKNWQAKEIRQKDYDCLIRWDSAYHPLIVRTLQLALFFLLPSACEVTKMSI